MNEELRTAIEKVIEGFERGVFMRAIDRDHEPGWALRLAPYVAALAKLNEVLEPAPPIGPAPVPGHGPISWAEDKRMSEDGP